MNCSSNTINPKIVPRFGRGQLPVEYVPLNSNSLKVGEIFGPLPFQISMDSHQHHGEYIWSGGGSSAASVNLYPFEFWPLPRVLSQFRFGRLNEVISVRATREIRFRPEPSEMLFGQTRVKAIENHHGLCFGFFESRTVSESGECLFATDTLLLANDCVQSKLKQAVEKTKEARVFGKVDAEAAILTAWTLQMRFPWPTAKWHNNIHTEDYARSLGYERALVEGPGIVDVVCSFHESRRGPLNAFRVAWKYIGPLYEGLHVALLDRPSNKPGRWNYLVCEFPTSIPGQCRAILSLELGVP